MAYSRQKVKRRIELIEGYKIRLLNDVHEQLRSLPARGARFRRERSQTPDLWRSTSSTSWHKVQDHNEYFCGSRKGTTEDRRAKNLLTSNSLTRRQTLTNSQSQIIQQAPSSSAHEMAITVDEALRARQLHAQNWQQREFPR